MKRKLLTFITLAALSIPASAYKPLLVEGRTWIYTQYNNSPDIITYVRSIEGDTIIEGKCYQRLIEPESKKVIAYMREEGEKVFKLRVDNEGATDFDNETLLYDFGTPVGSTFTIQAISELDRGLDDYELTVLKSETKNFSNNTYVVKTVARSYDYREERYGYPIEFAESLGCLEFGTLETIYLDPYPARQVYFPFLLTVKEKDGTVLYDYYQLGVDEINSSRVDDGRMYDLSGREIREPQRGTVYIQGGRKMVKR